MHEGSLLRSLVKDLKRENGTTRADIAGKMGITPEHLSTVFNRERLTAEIKSRAIRALSLPPDYFDEKQQEPPPPSREESLNALREELREKKREVESWKDKYLRLLEEYNLHLKDKKA